MAAIGKSRARSLPQIIKDNARTGLTLNGAIDIWAREALFKVRIDALRALEAVDKQAGWSKYQAWLNPRNMPHTKI